MTTALPPRLAPDIPLAEMPAAGTATLPAALLERILRRPASAWTVEDLVSLVEERGVRLVSLLHVGGDGGLKTLDFVPQSRDHLRDILAGGERADGSSLFPGLGIQPGASDVLLRPRPAGAFLDPFAPLPTLAVLCGHAGRDGAPLPQSPDTIVHAGFEHARRQAGVELYALGEVEFFLGRRPRDGDVFGARDRGYHATAPFVFGESLRRRALAILAELGVPVKYGHSEVGYVQVEEGDGLIWEQHEIELGLAPLPRAADGVAITRWVLRQLAQQEGVRVSFDPIVRRGHPGTGLHFHLSPVRNGGHEDVLRADGTLSEPARWLIGGLVEMGGALMAFGNRSDDSYLRLAQAQEAPSGIAWGEADRTALVRLPVVATTAEGRPVAPPTVEFRLPDGSAHAHLLLAAMAQALVHGFSEPGVDALLASTRAGAVVARSTSSPPPARIPASPAEVARALRSHRAALEQGGVFPAALLDQVVQRLES